MTPTYIDHRILLVEDNEFDIELARTAFDAIGLPGEPIVTRDGQEALDYLRREGEFAEPHPPSPQLVLLDLHMPRLDGLDVLRSVKQDQRLRDIPVVVFTTSNAPADRAACAALGADDYQVKPNDFGEFLTLVQLLTSRWLAPSDPRPSV